MNSSNLATTDPVNIGHRGAVTESTEIPMQGTHQPILVTQNLTMKFGAFVALNNVSATFEQNKLTAIIGPNGAGKSTFFNLVSGAFPPTQGRIRFQGNDITGMAQHQFARIGIAKSFQITNVFKLLSAHENVRVAAQMRSTRFELLRPRADLKDLIDKADALLQRVGLNGLRDKRAGDLAHGQQRCLEIAMALACEPRLLLLDEPTAGMSPEETLAMMDLITSLAEERTVILVEHKMKLVMGICQHLLVLHHGEVLAEGTPDDIRTNDEVKRVYLGQSI
jgi:branched-chain amino acid transport system ATP-binding protein